VLNNLLTNAIKFTPRSGTLTLEGKNYPEGFRVKIIDTGVGIPHDKLPSLLNKYAQTHTLGTEGENGTGWGLLLCEKILEAHGSKLDISSELHVGSTFAFLLYWDDPADLIWNH